MEVPRHWRLKKQRYALVGETCPKCASYLFPPRAVCPVCAERAKEIQGSEQRTQVMVLEEHMQPVAR
ncbi:MAG: hypothetical protein IH586_14845 [Anaerolineaceae bacterium]|nr:hypothetical protein [Anaerolineaceae bacterium]